MLAAAVLAPFATVAASSVLRDVARFDRIDVGSSTIALAALPYGLAWLLTGARMAVRGSSTITDPPTDPTPATEVQPA